MNDRAVELKSFAAQDDVTLRNYVAEDRRDSFAGDQEGSGTPPEEVDAVPQTGINQDTVRCEIWSA